MDTIVRVFSLIFLIGVVGVTVGCQEASQLGDSSRDQSPVAGTVQLEIVFNSDRKNIHVAVPCSSDSTVFTILERARNMGDLQFDSTGLTKDMMLVTSIGGVDNLAGQGDNWVYRVNGKLGDKSSGIYPVKPGDHVLWAFGKYEENAD